MNQLRLGILVFHTNAQGETRPAIVTKVHNATCADLTIFAPGRTEYLSEVLEGSQPGCFTNPDAIAVE